MDKFVNLCFECRYMFREFYRVDVEDAAAPEAKKNKEPVCENCGTKFGLKVCRVRTKMKGEKHDKG